MNRITARILFCWVFMLLVSCTALQPKLENPSVTLVCLRMLQAQGLQQRVAVDLLIGNSNKQDLSIRGISYTIGIENISVLSGLSNEIPVLKSNQETPVTLEVTAGLLEILQLVEHFSHNGIGENVNYNFSAVIDFSAWLPSMRVDKKGVLPLGGEKA